MRQRPRGQAKLAGPGKLSFQETLGEASPQRLGPFVLVDAAPYAVSLVLLEGVLEARHPYVATETHSFGRLRGFLRDGKEQRAVHTSARGSIMPFDLDHQCLPLGVRILGDSPLGGKRNASPSPFVPAAISCAA